MINFPFAPLHLRPYRNALPAIGLRAAFDNPGEILVIKRTDKLRPEVHQVTLLLNIRIQLSDVSLRRPAPDNLVSEGGIDLPRSDLRDQTVP
jgi:hypothetical protein